MDRLGDDLCLVAVDATGGELLSDGERIEHRGSLPRGRRARNQPRCSGGHRGRDRSGPAAIRRAGGPEDETMTARFIAARILRDGLFEYRWRRAGLRST